MKESSGEIVCKLVLGIVFLHQVQELREVVSVDLCHVSFVEATAILPRCGRAPISFIKLRRLRNILPSHPNGIVRLNAEGVIRQFLRHTPQMRTSVSRYNRHRFPAEIISQWVWLYFRFALSFGDVEEMLAMRGVSLGYETV